MNNSNILRARNLNGDFSNFFAGIGHIIKEIFKPLGSALGAVLSSFGHLIKKFFTSKVWGESAFVVAVISAFVLGALASIAAFMYAVLAPALYTGRHNIKTTIARCAGWIVGAVIAGNMINKYSLSPRCDENDKADSLDYDHKLGKECLGHTLLQLWGFAASTAVTTFAAEAIYSCVSNSGAIFNSYNRNTTRSINIVDLESQPLTSEQESSEPAPGCISRCKNRKQ